MTENNSPENAGDQDENAAAPADLVTPELRPMIDKALERAAGGVPAPVHGRPIGPELPPLVERYAAAADAKAEAAIEAAGRCVQVERGEPHDRHVFGPAAAPVHCPGLRRDDMAGLGTYADELAAWEAENPWSAKYRPLVHHARVLARKLDRDDDAPASLSSAYLQAITRLERFRPGAAAGDGGDGLTPAGRQPSIFDAMED